MTESEDNNIAYQSWSVSYGEQPTAAKWNILGTNDASFNDGTGIADGVILPNHLFASASTLNTHAWDSYTPIFANTTLGNGSVAGSYIKIGRTIFFKASFILGSTSAIGSNPTVTLPVTASSTNMIANVTAIGVANYYDTGAAIYSGQLIYGSTTTAQPTVEVVSGTYAQLSGLTATIPVAYATGDSVNVTGYYLAA